MSYSQIRINKTKDLKEMLKFLQSQLKLLSESDIIKLALSEFYLLRRGEQYTDTSPVEFGPLPEEDVTPGMKEKAEAALEQFQTDPSSFTDIR